ncbi:MAG: UvrB/UvrC motif-containing protein [Candidatus Omnitrophota bacterium]|nr:hypothetical protein [Candidatus Omnitrophota bacterium]MBU2528250.1 UvrB/UvrC motif-containing protein [bacterium]MBU3929628.1 UvrB/UvrC motif-containing protein [bacterium]MBU4122191.1 UvrB/UvrC motif-containing protein [bacterium]
MICDICKVNPASVHFTSFHGGAVTKMHICHSCAVNMGVFDVNMQEKSFDILGKFLSALALPGTVSDRKCRACGKTLSEFREDGKLGCPECWETFRENLEPLLKKIHGHALHKQSAEKTKDTRVSALQKKLQEAIGREDYEEAAKIRDRIKALRCKK